MKMRRISLIYITILSTITLSTTYAHAKRFMLVLLDASGSMQATVVGASNPNVHNRFQLAADNAREYVSQLSQTEEILVDLYTFRDLGLGAPTLVEHTNGFVTTQTVNQEIFDIIECVGGIQTLGTNCGAIPANLLSASHEFPVNPLGGTPLADAMCTTRATLASAGVAGDLKTLFISSDGEENVSTGPCHGTLDGTFDGSAWTAGSWQANTINDFAIHPDPSGHTTTHVDIFQLPGLPFGPIFDPESDFSRGAVRLAMPIAAGTISPLQQFFISITQITGGQVRVYNDNEPPPLFADVNGGRCVDITDAVLVARSFGAPAFGSALDVNIDGKIGFPDYQIVTRNLTGGCGTPNPYVRRDPILCKGADRVVLDGQSIADGGITIDVRGSCQLTIRNSLIVSGRNAITIAGSAVVTVDNSIIVGENAVIMQHGAGVLSSANSVFHGKLDTQGAFQYIDRGGNTFE